MTEQPSTNRTLKHRLWRRTRVLLLLYLGICLLMMALETFLVYPRPPVGSDEAWQLTEPGQEDVYFTAADGTKLHGWFFAQDQPQQIILYCHGNGEDISRNAAYMSYLQQTLNAVIFIFDYRGYGKSEGSPHEAGIILDGLAAQRWLAERADIAPDEVVVMGRSLGGGVAVAIAEQQGARALVLQNTFANLSEVASQKFFWLPVQWIMRNRYPSDERITNYDGPVLQTHGTADRVVPYSQGEKLFAAAPGTLKQWIKNEGVGHNAPLPSSYFQQLAAFLNNLPK